MCHLDRIGSGRTRDLQDDQDNGKRFSNVLEGQRHCIDQIDIHKGAEHTSAHKCNRVDTLYFQKQQISYAMALTFKHIGKALAVVLVILQIPGSSGTYPIEMTPVFFQRLHPLLPFSYGIGAMRECIAGFYKNNYAKDLLTLLLFLLLAFFIGLVLRPLLMNLNHLFDKRLAETDLMLGETATGELSRPQLTLMMKTMMQDEDGRADFIQRANRFEKRYPKLIRTGFILILVIPLIFLLLMFGLESKIVYLTLWIISLIVLAVYLICVEYIHDKTSRQLSYIHLSEEEFLKKVKEGKDE